jgi:hypothetical protein
LSKELVFIPLTGIYIDTGIALALEIFGTRFPFFQGFTLPALDVLSQYSVYQVYEFLFAKR